MPVRAIPARGGWVSAWWTPAWAATVRPTISAVAAIPSTAVIHRRARRVMMTSLIQLLPRSRDQRCVEAPAAPDGDRLAPAPAATPGRTGTLAHERGASQPGRQLRAYM